MVQRDRAAGNGWLFDGVEALPALSADCAIETEDGLVPAAWLRPGDKVLTLDRGFQPLLGLGTLRLPRRRAVEAPGLWPVSFAPGALGAEGSGAATVTSDQRMLLRGAAVELTFGLSEALVAARHLIGWPGVDCAMPVRDAVLHQLVFRHHELILADGIWTESLFLSADALAGLRRDAPGAFALLGDTGHGWLVRPELRDWEAALLPVPGTAQAAARRRA